VDVGLSIRPRGVDVNVGLSIRPRGVVVDLRLSEGSRGVDLGLGGRPGSVDVDFCRTVFFAELGLGTRSILRLNVINWTGEL